MMGDRLSGGPDTGIVGPKDDTVLVVVGFSLGKTE